MIISPLSPTITASWVMGNYFRQNLLNVIMGVLWVSGGAVPTLYGSLPITAGRDTLKDTLTKTAHGHSFKSGLAALA
jgi:hypothetical protein